VDTILKVIYDFSRLWYVTASEAMVHSNPTGLYTMYQESIFTEKMAPGLFIAYDSASSVCGWDKLCFPKGVKQCQVMDTYVLYASAGHISLYDFRVIDWQSPPDARTTKENALPGFLRFGQENPGSMNVLVLVGNDMNKLEPIEGFRHTREFLCTLAEADNCEKHRFIVQELIRAVKTMIRRKFETIKIINNYGQDEINESTESDESE